MIGVAVLLAALSAPPPAQCLSKSNDAFVVEHAGKTYRMASEECRAQFLSDPERYAQLYDALMELEAAGRAKRAAAPSLVPS